VMLKDKKMSWADIARVMSETPAKIAQLSDHGRPIKENEIANLCVVDPEFEWIVDENQTYSLSKNNPYVGLMLKSKVIHTIHKGKFTYKSGEIVL
ncbi:MAG: dihydroorotase, partial [Actinomycetota bacterium]